jgi:hypothetical protein
METSQGQLLEMHLLESRLLDTFFKNVNCSTQKVSTARHKKCQLLDSQKYAVRVPHFVFEQMIKKVKLIEI